MSNRALWDSQWVNVVNHDDCYRDYSKAEAVDKAVRLTEAYAAENIAAIRAQHAAELIALISHPRIRFAPPSEDLIAANGYGEMPHPVCQVDED